MAKAVEFRINIKSEDGGVLKRLTVEADGLDDILSEVGNTAVATGNRLREMADKSLVFETAVRSIRDLSDMVGGLAEPFDSFETAMRLVSTIICGTSKLITDVNTEAASWFKRTKTLSPN
uniref:hypothetical protein n=1 Tax=Prevotella sp. TaxID=59823 RepID=UPI00402A5A2B